MSDIVFMDTETLGIDIAAPIWEFAAVRRLALGDDIAAEKSLHLFIRHHAPPWLDGFPEEFARDYHERYSDRDAVSQLEAAQRISEFMQGRPHVVGAVPSFDTERIAHQWLRPNRMPAPWHYHLIDVENLVVGYLRSVRHEPDAPRDQIDRLTTPPWSSDLLSEAIGINPDAFDRHTAMGDVRWTQAQYDVVMGVIA